MKLQQEYSQYICMNISTILLHTCIIIKSIANIDISETIRVSSGIFIVEKAKVNQPYDMIAFVIGVSLL